MLNLSGKIFYDSVELRAHIDTHHTAAVVGYANGVYDLLHDGHKELLQQASSKCDFLIASVVTDEHARVRKGPERPIDGRMERAYNVAALSYVDAVLMMDHQWHNFYQKWVNSPKEFKPLKADIAFFGSDYNSKTLATRRTTFAKQFMFVEQDMGCHTTDILAETADIDKLRADRRQTSKFANFDA